MGSERIVLPQALPYYDPPIRCGSKQCSSCPIHAKYCGGWLTCCGGADKPGVNRATDQRECSGGCDQCLGMDFDNSTNAGHAKTWDVCGKPQAVLREAIDPTLPEPTYSVPMLSREELPLYVPSFTRLPRGPMKTLPKQEGLYGIQAYDVSTHRRKPEKWTDYAERFIMVCTEKDVIQDSHESWYGSWCRWARSAGHIQFATGIEFSGYGTHGNLSQYRAIFRSFRSANAAQAELWATHFHTRLNAATDRVFENWLKAVPNMLWPFWVPENKTAVMRLFRCASRVYGPKWPKRVRILLAHTPLKVLRFLPDEVKRSASWLDQSAFPSALAGGTDERPKPDIFVDLVGRRRAKVEARLKRVR